MRGKKIIAVLSLLAVLLACLIFSMLWCMDRYVVVDHQFYPKSAQSLDLREAELSVRQYEKLQKKLPGTRILWSVPFQETTYESDITALTVTSLTEEDVSRLELFDRLEVLHGENCQDYAQLMAAADAYPRVQVLYQVPVGGNTYSQDADTVALSTVSDRDSALLEALPKLETVILEAVDDPAAASMVQDYCRAEGIRFCVKLGEETFSEEAKTLSVTGITDEQLALLQFLPGLKQLHLSDPVASADQVLALADSGLEVTWDKNICGKVYDHTATDIDLSDTQITSLEEVEQAMEYLPQAKEVFLGLPGLDNEAIAAYRERSREKYKVVWVVDLSGKMQVRTDIDNFMPSRDGWGYVRDHEIDNIRYCEELICIDIGHMGIRDVSFLEPLVNLEYLILAHTEVQYIDPIVNCKKLKYLELDWSTVRDVSPLVELTALEDLNLGMTWPDITPILQMTWLKNLYLIKGNTRANFAEALPNTRVVTSGDYTVSSGWRNLPNYYAMRDILGMYYM